MLIIWNEQAGRAETCTDLREEFAARPGVVVRDTSCREEATALAAKAARTHGGLVVAAGGDGTINAVVSGLMDGPQNVQLAVLPLGTGNDLCRTLAIPLDPYEAAALLERPVARPLDIVHSRTESTQNFFINLATGGNSALVMDHLTEDMKLEVLPKALAVVAGPDYTPDPEGLPAIPPGRAAAEVAEL